MRKRNKIFKNSRHLVLLGAIVLLAVGCSKPSDRPFEPPANPPQAATQGQPAQQPFQDAVLVNGTPYWYPGKEGKTALELLKERFPGKVQTTQTSSGEVVTAIDGKKADGKYFWKFYVNGIASSVSPGSYVTTDEDLLSWKLEEIKSN